MDKAWGVYLNNCLLEYLGMFGVFGLAVECEETKGANV